MINKQIEYKVQLKNKQMINKQILIKYNQIYFFLINIMRQKSQPSTQRRLSVKIKDKNDISQRSIYELIKIKALKQYSYEKQTQQIKKQIYQIPTTKQLRQVKDDIEERFYDLIKKQNEKNKKQKSKSKQSQKGQQNIKIQQKQNKSKQNQPIKQNHSKQKIKQLNDKADQEYVKSQKNKFIQLNGFLDKYITAIQLCYDQQTFDIYNQICSINQIQSNYKKAQKIKHLYDIKAILMIRISNLSFYKENMDRQRQLQVSDKLLKLTALHSMVDQSISQVQQQFIIPSGLQEYFSGKMEDQFRQINFYFGVAWIISFLLASRDKSECITNPVIGQTFTFRDWLWANGGISLASSILLLIFAIFYKKQYTQSKMNRIKLLIKTVILIITLLVCIGKAVWLLIGIILFLARLTFDENCSDDVVTYCSLQFVAFFMLAMFSLLRYIRDIISSKSQKLNITKKQTINYNFQRSLQQLEPLKLQQVVYDPSIHRFALNNDDLQQARAYYGMAQSDFQDICERFFSWTLLGWVYHFVLWRKDQSECLDKNIALAYTFRQWLVIDASTSVVFWISIIFLIVVKQYQKSQFLMLYWQKYQLYQFESRWFMKNWITKGLGILLIIQVLFKFIWMIVGVITFCFYLQDCENTGTFSNYMVFYFTQAMYVTYETTAAIIKGHNHKSSIGQKYEQRKQEQKQRRQKQNKQQQRRQQQQGRNLMQMNPQDQQLNPISADRMNIQGVINQTNNQ